MSSQKPIKLQAVQKDIKTIAWCGPSAISAVTGKPLSEVVRALKDITGRQQIKGLSGLALCKGLRHFGVDAFCTEEFGKGTRPTLATWLREAKRRGWTGPSIVNVTGHYVVVDARRFVDNRQQTPVPHKQARGRRARVVLVFALRRAA